jgi:uncharacterized surface protein with fasciclin (FAS1) repeats
MLTALTSAVSGELSPDEIEGEHEGLMFDEAGLVCGGVHTDNAVVYMIDGVLMPAAAEE